LSFVLIIIKVEEFSQLYLKGIGDFKKGFKGEVSRIRARRFNPLIK